MPVLSLNVFSTNDYIITIIAYTNIGQYIGNVHRLDTETTPNAVTIRRRCARILLHPTRYADPRLLLLRVLLRGVLLHDA